MSSAGVMGAGMAYSSLAQRPKSICLHRSEQNGRFGFFVEYVCCFPQLGHLV
jgi:hypothetical protein